VDNVSIEYSQGESFFRLELIRREEARQRRLVRKLLERQRMNMDPVPIYQVQKTMERSYPDHVFPPDLVCRNQLYRVWGAVPPARQLWRQRRRADGGRSGRRHGGERDIHHIDFNRGDPDGGEDNTNTDDPSMDEVIQSAKEVRRLIRGSSTNSLSYDDLQSGDIDISEEDITHCNEEYSEDNQDYLSMTNTDFRELLQLTSIDDDWSDTRSIRQSSVISFSPSQPRQTRRQSVLSCSSAGLMEQESLYWEDEAAMELGRDAKQSVDLVIRCGEIVTSDTDIKMVMQ
jgi:hypothetical protein